MRIGLNSGQVVTGEIGSGSLADRRESPVQAEAPSCARSTIWKRGASSPGNLSSTSAWLNGPAAPTSTILTHRIFHPVPMRDSPSRSKRRQAPTWPMTSTAASTKSMSVADAAK